MKSQKHSYISKNYTKKYNYFHPSNEGFKIINFYLRIKYTKPVRGYFSRYLKIDLGNKKYSPNILTYTVCETVSYIKKIIKSKRNFKFH